MPNLKNYSRSEAKVVLDLLGVKYKIEGYGYVDEQSINEKEKITKDMEITLKLKSKYIENGDDE